MKFYDIDTKFDFGKYTGKTLQEVLEIQPSYINWCIINLTHFYISEDVIDEIKSIKPDFTLSEEELQKLDNKYDTWNEQEIDKYDKHTYYSDDYDWDRETFDALTDGMYGDYDENVDIDSLMTFLGRG
ncbi:MAG: hypothetical protein LBC68_02035 [Prevotellaceae bacterium]|jgi:hypothetical protein|nr:hypothetical protein [Prevotellaceae bacterium]